MKRLITLLFTINCFLAGAADLYVMPGAPSPYYSTITAAVTAASDGDRIIVSPGSYVGNLTIEGKGISIIPISSGGDYTVVGNIIIQLDDPTPDPVGGFEVNLIGANVNGFIENAGSALDPGSAARYMINIIDCDIQGHVYLATFGAANVGDRISCNLYYSTFHSYVKVSSSLEVIGNFFNNDNFSVPYVDFTLYDCEYFWIEPNSTVKIIANHFTNYHTAFIIPHNDIDKLLIANNYMHHNGNAPSQYYSYPLCLLDDATVEVVIENNAFRRQSGENQQGTILQQVDDPSLSIAFRNNIIFDRHFGASFSRFKFESTSGAFFFENNFFNNPFPSGNAQNVTNWWSNLPAIRVINENVSASWPWNSDALDGEGMLDPTTSSGTSVLGYTVDGGKDIIDCRDIDDTRNDIGRLGGPHSYDNYHLNNTSGQARVIDIDIPYIIYPLPGISFDINAKTRNTNQ